MKKLFSILIAISYFILTIGVSFNVHYCEGEMESISVFEEIDDKCCSDETEVSCIVTDECCDYEIHHLSFYSEEQLINSNYVSLEQFDFIDKSNSQFLTYNIRSCENTKSNYIEISPHKLKTKYIHNCSLLFYG